MRGRHWHGLLRSPSGEILAGYGEDSTGTPTWWSRADGGRRRRVSSRAEAERLAKAAAGAQ